MSEAAQLADRLGELARHLVEELTDALGRSRRQGSSDLHPNSERGQARLGAVVQVPLETTPFRVGDGDQSLS